MRNLTKLFQNGNLTPKERYLLLIQNDVTKENTGKDQLTEADKNALEDWKAKTNEEAKEWNTYNEGWKKGGRMGIEAEFVYQQVQVEHFRKLFVNLNLSFYPFYREQKRLLERLEKIKTVTSKEAAEISDKQRKQKLKSGLDFDYAVYQLAFENLSEEDREDFIELYSEIETEPSYLDEEEIIATLFDRDLTEKDTQIAREKLSELVSKKSYNTHAKQHQLYHYFACIPVAEVARHFLISKGVTIKGKPLAQNQEVDDEDSTTHDDIQKVAEKYVTEHSTTMEAILKEGCLDWLNNDLFDQYTPLALCHAKELLDRWIATKAKARAILEKHINKGTLKIEEKNEDKIITGDSLYAFTGKYKFVEEFRNQVDTYTANLGILYADDDPTHTGGHLDQELLVSNKNDKGELFFFSMFGMTTTRLSAFLTVTQFIEETKENGEIVLDFRNQNVKETFVDARQGLIDGYSKLLAYRDIFKKLSDTYEIDLCHTIDMRVAVTEEYIHMHNQALDTAIGKQLSDDDPDKESESWLVKQTETIRTRDDYVIHKETILPDADVLDEYTTEFRNIFGRGEF